MFLNAVELDLQDAVYPLYTAPEIQLSILLKDGQLQLQQQTVAGKQALLLSEDDTYQCLTQLRMQSGIAAPLAQILLQTFGHPNGAEAFQTACQQMGIATKTVML